MLSTTLEQKLTRWDADRLFSFFVMVEKAMLVEGGGGANRGLTISNVANSAEKGSDTTLHDPVRVHALIVCTMGFVTQSRAFKYNMLSFLI